MISMWIAFLCFILLDENKLYRTEVQPVPHGLSQGYKFESAPAWTDEFDYTGKPDPAKWGYDIGGDGWGNNELQYYTDNITIAA